mmetsp:Transcript_94497/g.282121  ORF Transcript_94497/g.282121 Transcript_94497/m.282121 type:complete len:222 (+) Transcript_94497:563-1228(+)
MFTALAGAALAVGIAQDVEAIVAESCTAERLGSAAVAGSGTVTSCEDEVKFSVFALYALRMCARLSGTAYVFACCFALPAGTRTHHCTLSVTPRDVAVAAGAANQRSGHLPSKREREAGRCRAGQVRVCSVFEREGILCTSLGVDVSGIAGSCWRCTSSSLRDGRCQIPILRGDVSGLAGRPWRPGSTRGHAGILQSWKARLRLRAELVGMVPAAASRRGS